MTNDILDGRRKNLVKKNIEGRESLDEGEVYHFEPINRNYSAYNFGDKEDDNIEKASEKGLTGVLNLKIDQKTDLNDFQQIEKDIELSMSIT